MFSECHFNPRTREGCDLAHDNAANLATQNFNPRTREGCDFHDKPFLSASTIFQSTHPRGVRLFHVFPCRAAPIFQSTHPRGVRRVSGAVLLRRCGFQSTHPRGVRPYFGLSPVMSQHFNPRTREGCDSSMQLQIPRHLAFQSTHPRGVRRGRPSMTQVICRFQSTHPRGVRRYRNRTVNPDTYFNPRTREGCDRLQSGREIRTL